MQRYRVNYTLLIGLLVGSVVAAGSIYGIWTWQMTGNANSLLERANAAEQKGDYREAVGLLNDYLAFRPNDDKVRIKQAELYVDLGNKALEEGEIRDFAIAKDSIINTLFKYPGEDELRAELVEMLMKPNIAQYFAKDVLGHVKTLLAKTPDDAELLKKKALCLVALKQPDDAVNELYKLVGYDAATETFDAEKALSPDDVDAYRTLARVLLAQLDRKDLALRVEEQLVEVNPDSPDAHLERGRFLAMVDEGEGSRADYGEESSQALQRAYELDPTKAETLLALASEAQQNEDFDLTREYLEKGLELGTDMAVFYSALGRLEREKGDHASAIAQIEQGLKAVDEKQRPYLLLDKIDFQIDAENLAGAEETIKELERQVDIKLPQVEFQQARILAARGEWLQAARMLEETQPKLAGDPRLRPQLDMLLGLAYRKVGYMEKALEVFEQLARENPSNRFASAQVEDLRRRRGLETESQEVDTNDFNERLAAELKKPEEEQDWEAFDAFIDSWSEEFERSDVQRKLLKTQVLINRKMYEEARNLLREAYEEAPDDLSIQRAVVRMVAVDPDRGPETAMKLLDRTIGKFGDQWQLRLDRADLYMAMNRETLAEDLMSLTEGIDDFERSQQIELWKGIAARLARAGKREESEAAWQKVAELDPNDLPTLMQVFELALVRNDDEAMREAQQKVLALVGSKSDANWAFTEAARKYVQFRNDPSQEKLREDILKLVDTALQQRPDWNAPYILRASLAVNERDYLQALSDYKEGFSRGRGNAQALAQYVKLLAAQGSYNEALEQLDQYDAATNVMLVGQDYPKLLLQVGRYRDAVEAAGRISTAGENSANVQLWYGQFLQAVGSVAEVPEDLQEEIKEKAGKALATAVELGGDNPAPWLAHINFLLSTGNLSAAETALREAQLKLEEDQQQLLTAKAYERMGRWFDAENLYRLAYEQNPEAEQIARQLATFYLSNFYPRPDGPTKAVSLINDILRKHAEDSESVSRDNATWARRTAAQLLAATGDYQNLLKAEKLLASNTVNGTLAVEDKLQMASILAVRPEPVSRNKAIQLLEEVQSQQRLSPELDLTLGKLYFAVDNWPKCRDHMQTVLTRYPNSFPVRDAYIRMLIDRGTPGDLRVAEGQVRQLIEIAPRQPATLELVSLVYNAMGDENRAKQALRRMLPSDLKNLDDNGYRLIARVAMLLTNVGDIETAEKLMTVLAQRPGATVADQLQFAQFVGVHRDPQRGMDLLDKLVDDSNLLEVADVAAKIVRAKRDTVGDKFDEKINGWLTRAQREDPDSVTVELAIANFRDLQGEYEEAAKIYRKVLDNDRLTGTPKAAVLNNLAYLLALGAAEEKSPNEAVSLLREAVEILGPISDILDTRATIWIERGEYQAAVDDMQLAVTDKPTASKYFHKALAHMGMGQKSDALAAWKRAEDLGLTRESVGRLEQPQYDKLKGQIEALQRRGENT